MTTKRSLINRWKTESGQKLLERVKMFFYESSTIRHGNNTEELRLLLHDLPYCNEVVNGKDLRGVILSGGVMDLNFAGWDFSYATLDMNLIQCNLIGACFKEAFCSGIISQYLDNANFQNANLKKCFMEGVIAKNCCFDYANLQKVNFSKSDLSGSSFINANAKEATFFSTNILSCNFRNAILDQATICSTILDKTVDFRGTSLIELDDKDWLDNKGNLIATAIDWRQANHDATTIYGTDPNAYTRDVIQNAISILDEAHPLGKALITKLENLNSNPEGDLRKKLIALMQAVSGEEKELLDEVLDEAYKIN